MCHQEGGLRSLTRGQLSPFQLQKWGVQGCPPSLGMGRGDVSLHLEVLLVMKKPRMEEQDGTAILAWLGTFTSPLWLEGARCGGGRHRGGGSEGPQLGFNVSLTLDWGGGHYHRTPDSLGHRGQAWEVGQSCWEAGCWVQRRNRSCGECFPPQQHSEAPGQMGGGSFGEERPAPGPPLTQGHLHPAPPWRSLPPRPLVDDGSQGVRPRCLTSSGGAHRGRGGG